MRRQLTAAAIVAAALFCAGTARAEWQNDANGVAWLQNGQTVWKYNLDPTRGKTHFYPLGLAGGPSLVIASPEDHLWHYGLWFSWKYLNGSNYWEQSRETGKAEGATTWRLVSLKANADGSARLRLLVTYNNKSGRVDMIEMRTISVSKPRTDGAYTIDWDAHFTAGTKGALLDRTAMPGEADGQVNGGYGGLGVRLAPPPYEVAFVTAEGPIDSFDSNRARPRTSAVAANFSEGGRPVGGLAVHSRPDASGAKVPWYVVDASRTDAQMRFFNQSLLAPKVIKLRPHARLHLGYRIGIAPLWTPEDLRKLGTP